jgi:hypothetical protein
MRPSHVIIHFCTNGPQSNNHCSMLMAISDHAICASAILSWPVAECAYLPSEGKQARFQTVRRPTTRHGKHGQRAVPTICVNKMFASNSKPQQAQTKARVKLEGGAHPFNSQASKGCLSQQITGSNWRSISQLAQHFTQQQSEVRDCVPKSLTHQALQKNLILLQISSVHLGSVSARCVACLPALPSDDQIMHGLLEPPPHPTRCSSFRNHLNGESNRNNTLALLHTLEVHRGHPHPPHCPQCSD